jgi:integrase
VPVVARELTAPEVAAISAPGTHAVGGVTGLCLQVTSTGARSWLLRITVDERRREYGLGAFPTVTVLAARNAARTLRERIGRGADPALQRRAASAVRRVSTSKAVTFKACAEAYLAAELAKGRDARYVGVVLRDMERLAFPQLGHSRIGSVTTDSVLGVLVPVWTAKPTVATKLRGNIERVLAHAEAQGFRDGINPARWKGHLDGLLASPASVRQHERHASLPADQVPEFFAELSRMPGVAGLALQFLILTAARPRDVREMRWSELDMGGAGWNMPIEQSTTRIPCRVPLSKPALRLLATLRPAGPQSPVFTTPRAGLALSDMTLTAVLRRMNDQRRARGMHAWTDSMHGNREIAPAGFRATFRSWAAQTQVHLEGAGYLLSAPSEASTPAHARASGFERAKRALEAWARHCRHATES